MPRSNLAETRQQKMQREREAHRKRMLAVLTGCKKSGGLKGRDLAELWGVSESEASRILNGGSIKVWQLRAFAEAAGMDDDDILRAVKG